MDLVTATSRRPGRVVSSLITAAAVGSLAIGMAGGAAADPTGPPPTARFTVTNNTKDTVTFTGYDTKGGAGWIYEPAIAGPGTGHTLKSGESVWFDVQVWDKGGHSTGAEFTRGGTGWSVYMDANGKGNHALCVGSCDPIDRTSTTKITLH